VKGKNGVAKEEIKHMTGVFAAVFAHLGDISREEAMEIGGLEVEKFEQVYAKTSRIAEKLDKAEGKKMDVLLEYFGEEIEHWAKKVDPVF
jgi:hypothetical protein